MSSYARIASVLCPLFALATFGLGYLIVRSAGSPSEPTRPVETRPAFVVAPAASASAVFAGIYEQAMWGDNDAGFGTSGMGSTLEATAAYRAYLQAFLARHHITSVVDAGCGDWEFSKAMDWTGIDYRGFDIVPAVVAADTAKYEKANVHFAVANVVTDPLPPADLLIVKHVLQHLPNGDVRKVLEKLGPYRHVLLTNSVSHQLGATNQDIAVGGFRYLDPTAPPFALRGLKELTWWDGHHMQQVVHVQNPR